MSGLEVSRYVALRTLYAVPRDNAMNKRARESRVYSPRGLEDEPDEEERGLVGNEDDLEEEEEEGGRDGSRRVVDITVTRCLHDGLLRLHFYRFPFPFP